jgi:hypothetical protein
MLKLTFMAKPLSSHEETDFIEHNLIQHAEIYFLTTPLSSYAEAYFFDHVPFQPC